LKFGKYLEEFGGNKESSMLFVFGFVSLPDKLKTPIFCVLDVGSSKFGGNFA